jgi:hypothetical protein
MVLRQLSLSEAPRPPLGRAGALPALLRCLHPRHRAATRENAAAALAALLRSEANRAGLTKAAQLGGTCRRPWARAPPHRPPWHHRLAPTPPGARAPPPQRGGLPWPPQPASGRPPEPS